MSFLKRSVFDKSFGKKMKNYTEIFVESIERKEEKRGAVWPRNECTIKWRLPTYHPLLASKNHAYSAAIVTSKKRPQIALLVGGAHSILSTNNLVLFSNSMSKCIV